MIVYTCNSFALDKTGGNPAGVVLDAPQLSAEEYIEIAKTVGFSETAFVFTSKQADFKVRFFTPVEEVALCGHATIGTFFTLFETGTITAGSYTMETKAGILDIDIFEDCTVFMEQPNPIYYQKIKKAIVADSLNITTAELRSDLPLQIVSTGLKDLIVPILSLDRLNKLKPDFDKIAKISREYDIVGYHLFAVEDEKIYCRNFAPLLGIEEESATGTASGALAGYLFKHTNMEMAKEISIHFYQGFSMDKKSQIDVRITTENRQIKQIKVGGSCKNFQKKNLQ
ncbi:MAG: PhzF family phenazine biosynthesis protein [Fidelibacterota bacterium]